MFFFELPAPPTPLFFFTFFFEPDWSSRVLDLLLTEEDACLARVMVVFFAGDLEVYTLLVTFPEPLPPAIEDEFLL